MDASAFNVFQGKKWVSTKGADIQDGHDIRMPEASDRLGFDTEASQQIEIVAPQTADELQCDPAIRASAMCLVDDSHTAFAQT